MDLSSAAAVREFLVLCLNPPGRSKRTPAKLAEVMPDPLREALETYAPHLVKLRLEAEDLERQACKARKAHVDAFAAWITTGEEPAAAPAATDPGQCPQNRVGNFIRLTDPVQLGPHFYRENELGLRCVYCDVPAHWGGEPLVAPTVRPYVYNAKSVNRTTKHIVDPFDPAVTACPSAFISSPFMPSAEAALLPLCGGCRTALTGKTD